MIAGMFSMLAVGMRRLIWHYSLANEEEQVSECKGKSVLHGWGSTFRRQGIFASRIRVQSKLRNPLLGHVSRRLVVLLFAAVGYAISLTLCLK